MPLKLNPKPKIIQQAIIINLRRPSCKVADITVNFKTYLNFMERFR